jgi:hypothetical protein
MKAACCDNARCAACVEDQLAWDRLSYNTRAAIMTKARDWSISSEWSTWKYFAMPLLESLRELDK